MVQNGVKFCMVMSSNVEDKNISQTYFHGCLQEQLSQFVSRRLPGNHCLQLYIWQGWTITRIMEEIGARLLYFQEDGRLKVFLSISKISPVVFHRIRLFASNAIGNSSGDAWIHRGEISNTYIIHLNKNGRSQRLVVESNLLWYPYVSHSSNICVILLYNRQFVVLTSELIYAVRDAHR